MFENWQLRGLLGLRQIDVSLATGINMTRISLEERGLLKYNSVEQAAVRAYFDRMLQPYLSNFVEAYGYNPAGDRSLEVAPHG